MKREPIEDFRIDFEDGYGNRPDARRTATIADAEQVAIGMEKGHAAAVPRHPHQTVHGRTARARHPHAGPLPHDAAGKTGGKLPANFVVTLPKVTIPEQVETLVGRCSSCSSASNTSRRALALRDHGRDHAGVIGPDGTVPLRCLVAAAQGRCVGAHLGVYDYTASCNVTGALPGARPSRRARSRAT